MNGPVLSLTDLSVDFPTPGATVSAVDRVSLTVAPGELVGLVGESGCGKSTLASAVMGLLPPQARVSGSVMLEGEEIIGASAGHLRSLRGARMAMIFQDPSTSLDPTFSIGSQVADAIKAHQHLPAAQAREQAIRLLQQVGIPDAARRYNTPPHRFSGGMKQRVVIAAALANNPRLLIADEPTTALDVTIQAQILRLMASLAKEHHTGVLLITHDLGVVAQVCQRVGVMYAGQLVEEAPVATLFAAPQHPYTKALLAALPSNVAEGERLSVIPGSVPDLASPLPGCRFLNRCPLAFEPCQNRPSPVTVGLTRVACWAVEPSPDHS